MRLIGLALVLPGGLVFAGCPVGFDFGYVDKALPLPACIAYSGSTLGGCYVRCDQLCVNMPNSHTPDSWGPVFTTGEECSKGGGDNSGGDNSGGDNSGGDNSGGDNGNGDSSGNNGGDTGGNTGATGWSPIFPHYGDYASTVRVSLMTLNDNLGRGFARLNEENRYSYSALTGINGSARKIADNTFNTLKETSNLKYSFDANMASVNQGLLDIKNEIVKSNGLLEGKGEPSKPPVSGDSAWTQDKVDDVWQSTFSASNFLKNIQGNTRPLSNILNVLNDIKYGGVGAGSGSSGSGVWNQDSISFVKDRLFRSNENERDMIFALQDIKGLLESGSGSGSGEGGAGDKPSCVGPLCQFSGGGAASPSAMSNVFSDDDVAGIKTKYQEKQAEIKERIADIKSAMGFKTLSVSGQYETNIENIRGARVDLSGRSNLELFFSSGPKQMIMVLALLIAISLVMVGNRKNG
ncbi:hypothetical protein [Aeromonas schubertii]